MSDYRQEAEICAPNAAPESKPQDQSPAHRDNHSQTLARDTNRTRSSALCLSFPRLVIKKESALRPTKSVDSPTPLRPSEDIYATGRLDEAITSRAQSSPLQSQDFKQILSGVRQFASDVLQVNGIQCEITTPPDLKQIQPGPEQCQHLFWLFQEMLNHLVDQAQIATITLNITVDDQWLRIRIYHEGCGSVSQLLGQSTPHRHTLQARVIKLRGVLEIAAAPIGGTALTLSIPLAQ